MRTKSIILIAGPTASGKSTLALQVAQKINGTIVNADSLQVYDACPTLTAHPTPQEKLCCPHKLYGFVDPKRNYSVADWIADVGDIPLNGPLIFVGGTGLYFYSLTQGLNDIPLVPIQIRQEVEDIYYKWGAQKFYEELTKLDKETAAKLHPTDKQRVVRAMSVFRTTGKPLSFWKSFPKKPLFSSDKIHTIVLNPEKEALHKIAETRFIKMLKMGAIDEVKNLLDHYDLHNLSPTLTKAIGFKPIHEHIIGQLNYDELMHNALVQTKQYIKRQYTWFRNQRLPNSQILTSLNDPIEFL